MPNIQYILQYISQYNQTEVERAQRKDNHLRHLLENNEEVTEEQKGEVGSLIMEVEENLDEIVISLKKVLHDKFCEHPPSEQEIVKAIFQRQMDIIRKEATPVFYKQRTDLMRKRYPLACALAQLKDDTSYQFHFDIS